MESADDRHFLFLKWIEMVLHVLICFRILVSKNNRGRNLHASSYDSVCLGARNTVPGFTDSIISKQLARI